LKPQQGKPPPAELPVDPSFDVAESIRTLLAGDVVQRAVAAAALGDARSSTSQPLARLWAVPFLLQAMEDNYSSIRRLSWLSLEALVTRAGWEKPTWVAAARQLPRFEPQASEQERARVVGRWRQWWASLNKGDVARPDSAVPLDAALEPLPAAVEQLLRRRAVQPTIEASEVTTQNKTEAPGVEGRAQAHARFGWTLLFVSRAFGAGLETLEGFRWVAWVGDAWKQRLWSLAHFHGAALPTRKVTLRSASFWRP
jgi:hypothetical protein